MHTCSGVASPKILGGPKCLTLFCLEKRFSKHKMTVFSKILGGYGPFAPPGYAYAYKGVQKELKRTFLTAFEHREKEARILFAAQYFYRSCL